MVSCHLVLKSELVAGLKNTKRLRESRIFLLIFLCNFSFGKKKLRSTLFAKRTLKVKSFEFVEV